MNSNEKYAGFTLIEMLLVLIVVGLVTSFPLLQFSRWTEQYQVRTFIRHIEKKMARIQHAAVFSYNTSRMDIDGANNTISFGYFDVGKIKREEVITLPKGISTRHKTTLAFNGTTGNRREMFTFSFHDSINQRDIVYKIQMGSGKFVKTETKL